MTITAPNPAPNPATVATLAGRRVPGYSLEAPFYSGDDVFARDIESIFAAQWIFAAAEAEIPDAGDFVTLTFGTYSVIVIRDDDEEVRAMHNVCRHRGARILNEPTGSVGNIVCGYHKWTYRTDGSLMFAAAEPPDFDRSCLGLKQVHVRSVEGLIFICLADDPPADMDAVAGLVAPYLAPHHLADAKVAAQVDVIENGNWKLVMENNRECYHCDGHPELSCSFFPIYGYAEDTLPANLRPAYDRFLRAESDLHAACDRDGLLYDTIEDLTDRAVGFRIQREPMDGAGESFSADGAVVCRRPLGGVSEKRLGRLSMHTQPNAWFHVLSDHAVVFSVLPIAVDKTLLRTTWLVDAGAEEGVDYDVDALTTVWNHTNNQDAVLVSRAQLGIASPAYEPGPYAPNEYQVDAFCTWYIARLLEREHQ